nr:MAG TPA: hypothetical protein [Caudoviricetes sp.]
MLLKHKQLCSHTTRGLCAHCKSLYSHYKNLCTHHKGLVTSRQIACVPQKRTQIKVANRHEPQALLLHCKSINLIQQSTFIAKSIKLYHKISFKKKRKTI